MPQTVTREIRCKVGVVMIRINQLSNEELVAIINTTEFIKGKPTKTGTNLWMFCGVEIRHFNNKATSHRRKMYWVRNTDNNGRGIACGYLQGTVELLKQTILVLSNPNL